MNFELKLLNWIKIYLMFYIKKLESINPEILVRTKELLKLLRYNEYKVKKIKNYDLKSH